MPLPPCQEELVESLAMNDVERKRLNEVEKINRIIGEKIGFRLKSELDMVFLILSITTECRKFQKNPLREQLLLFVEYYVSTMARFVSKEQISLFNNTLFFLWLLVDKLNKHHNYLPLCRSLLDKVLENELSAKKLYDLIESAFLLPDRAESIQIYDTICTQLS